MPTEVEMMRLRAGADGQLIGPGDYCTVVSGPHTGKHVICSCGFLRMWLKKCGCDFGVAPVNFDQVVKSVPHWTDGPIPSSERW